MYFFHMSWLIVFCHRHYTRCWVGVIIGLQDDEEDDFDPEDEFDPKTLGEKKHEQWKRAPRCSFRVLGRARFWSCAPHSKRLFLCILNIVSYGFGSTRGQGPRLSIRPTGRNFFLSLSEMWHMSKPVKKGLHFSIFWVILETCPNLWFLKHVQTCDDVLVQSAMQSTASVHTWNMSKPVMTFVFKVLRNRLLRYILQTCPNPGSQWGNTHHCLVGAIEIYLHDPMLHCLGRTQNMQIPYTYNICLWFMHIISRGSSKAYPQDDNLIHCYESPRWFFVPVGFCGYTPARRQGSTTVLRRYDVTDGTQPEKNSNHRQIWICWPPTTWQHPIDILLPWVGISHKQTKKRAS